MKRKLLWRVLSIFRDFWLILGVTLAMVIGLELIARVLLDLRNNSDNNQLIDLGGRSEIYRDQPWATDYWREDNVTGAWFASWSPYVYWRRNPFHGKYINIDQNGIRYTWNRTPMPSSDQIKIVMFGGSTLWGMGARDEYTIPSLVSKKLSAKDVDAWVTNMGEHGYVSTQEVIALMLELRKGNVPDLVVFYDGVNDTASSFQQGVAGIPQNEFNRRAEFNQLNWRGGILERSSLYWYAKFLVQDVRVMIQPNQAPATPSGRTSVELANATLDIYVANMQIVESLARTFGFQVIFYWQPDLTTKKIPSPSEKREVLANEGTAFFQQVNQIMKQRALSRTHNDFHDLSDAFDDRSETLFIDIVHISESGNERIADLIVQTLPAITSHNKTHPISNH